MKSSTAVANSSGGNTAPPPRSAAKAPPPRPAAAPAVSKPPTSASKALPLPSSTAATTAATTSTPDDIVSVHTKLLVIGNALRQATQAPDAGRRESDEITTTAAAAAEDKVNGLGGSVRVGSPSALLSVKARLDHLQDTMRWARLQMTEYESLSLREIELYLTTSGAGPAANRHAVNKTPPLFQQRALASSATFTRLCDLQVAIDAYVLPSSSSHAAGSKVAGKSVAADQQTAYAAFFNGAVGAKGESPAAVVPATDAIKALSDEFDALQRCRLYSYEGQIREMEQKQRPGDEPPQLQLTAASNGPDTTQKASATKAGMVAVPGGAVEPTRDRRWQHFPVLVSRMKETLQAMRKLFYVDSSYGRSLPASQVLFRQLQEWTQPLLRQLNEIGQAPPLEELTTEFQEQLRRLQFDVEELNHEQQQAITEGDMQKSEELYFEHVALAESMKRPFDDLEQLMKEYIASLIDAPQITLQQRRDALIKEVTKAIEQHSALLQNVAQDVERLREKKKRVMQARHSQKSAMSTYQQEWKKAFEANGQQQVACYHAMEQLERRLNELHNGQSLMMEDWLNRMTDERKKEEDAAALASFIDVRMSALDTTKHNLESAVDGLRQFSGAVHFCSSHASSFLSNVVKPHVEAQQLALRKDRLAQFRDAYLTLGDLRYKKARHAEEMSKQIEYYTLHQEIAMDVLNPKAKEFSQAKQRWTSAQADVLNQLRELDAQSERQLIDFKPTEQLLIKAGVSFVSPVEELEQRNTKRTQKLLEYKQIMEGATAGNGAAKSSPPAPPPLPIAPRPPTSISSSGGRVNTTTASLLKNGLPRNGKGSNVGTGGSVDALSPPSAPQKTPSNDPDGNRCNTSGVDAANKAPGWNGSLPILHSTEERSIRDSISSASAAAIIGSDRRKTK